MEQRFPCCPACGRTLEGLFDYPSVRIISFERLPLPEAIDSLSDAAVEKQLARRRNRETQALRNDGINMTPEIEAALRTNEVEQYLKMLASLVDKEVPPTELLPGLKPHGIFRSAYPVEGTRLLISLDESGESSPEQRMAEVQVLCPGPNLGSAGGPTLQHLGAVARVGYQGVLKANQP